MGSVRGWGEFNVSNSKVNNVKLNQQFENKKEKKTDPVKIYCMYSTVRAMYIVQIALFRIISQKVRNW